MVVVERISLVGNGGVFRREILSWGNEMMFVRMMVGGGGGS